MKGLDGMCGSLRGACIAQLTDYGGTAPLRLDSTPRSKVDFEWELGTMSIAPHTEGTLPTRMEQ